MTSFNCFKLFALIRDWNFWTSCFSKRTSYKRILCFKSDENFWHNQIETSRACKEWKKYSFSIATTFRCSTV